MGRTHKISDKKAKWRDKLQYKYAIALRVLTSLVSVTWEDASREWVDGIQYVSDPNGKRTRVESRDMRKNPLTDAELQRMRMVAKTEGMIPAIKYCRMLTEWDLLKAKRLVESLVEDPVEG
jgi:hypothetical protein